MSTGTTLFEVKNALVTLLAARPGLSGVTISYSYPMPDPVSGDHIWLGNAESINETPVMNDDALDEEYRLDLRVQVLKTQSEGQASADTRCKALLIEVQQLLAANPRLGLSSIHFAMMESWEHSCGPLGSTSTGNGSAFDCKIRVSAILE